MSEDPGADGPDGVLVQLNQCQLPVPAEAVVRQRLYRILLQVAETHTLRQEAVAYDAVQLFVLTSLVVRYARRL